MTIDSGWQNIVDSSLGINRKISLELDKQPLTKIYKMLKPSLERRSPDLGNFQVTIWSKYGL